MFLKARGRCSVRFGCKVIVLQSKRGWILIPPRAPLALSRLIPNSHHPCSISGSLCTRLPSWNVLVSPPCLPYLPVLQCHSKISLNKERSLHPAKPTRPLLPKPQKAPNSPGTSGGAIRGVTVLMTFTPFTFRGVQALSRQLCGWLLKDPKRALALSLCPTVPT